MTFMSKAKILITNDDGINAPGLSVLIEVMKELGDVTVVASENSMSGMGHAVTISSPLRLEQVQTNNGYEEYKCNGTPADCVKLGEQLILKQKPDLLVSGVNHGSNASINIIYSGTMAAVLEGAICGFPSIGFSLMDYNLNADFSASKKYIKLIAQKVLAQGLPKGVCLNVNFPAVNGNQIKGIKVCRQAKARWAEEFDERKDPRNKDYFWMTGNFQKQETAEDTDIYALENNYVSVVPVHVDFTAHYALPEINKLNF